MRSNYEPSSSTLPDVTSTGATRPVSDAAATASPSAAVMSAMLLSIAMRSYSSNAFYTNKQDTWAGEQRAASVMCVGAVTMSSEPSARHSIANDNAYRCFSSPIYCRLRNMCCNTGTGRRLYGICWYLYTNKTSFIFDFLHKKMISITDVCCRVQKQPF